MVSAKKNKKTPTIGVGAQRMRRGHLFNIRMSDAEVEKLNAVAAYLEMPASVAVRHLIRRAHEAITRGDSVGRL
jgi:hypothetical protein